MGEDIISKLGQHHPKQKRFLKAHLVDIKSGVSLSGKQHLQYASRCKQNRIPWYFHQRAKMDHFENNIITINFYVHIGLIMTKRNFAWKWPKTTIFKFEKRGTFVWCHKKKGLKLAFQFSFQFMIEQCLVHLSN